MHRIVPIALVVVGLIHLLPVTGVLGAAQLERLYGVALSDPGLVLLMRHRAVLFGLLGVFLIVAAFRPVMRGLALVAGLVSVLSFLLLAALTAEINAAIARVVIADWIALGLLLVAGAVQLRGRQPAPER